MRIYPGADVTFENRENVEEQDDALWNRQNLRRDWKKPVNLLSLSLISR